MILLNFNSNEPERRFAMKKESSRVLTRAPDPATLDFWASEKKLMPFDYLHIRKKVFIA